MGKTFYVTTPIYYVNDVPHIGHAYTTVAADAIARWKRQKGESVFFLTGTDEHGQKIETTARRGGEEPIELADRVVVRFKKLWELLHITNSDFIRTTEERHKASVTELFRRIEAKGDIYLGEYEGWYNVREEAFITDTQLEEIMAMPESLRPPIERVKEESYFFRLSRYAEPLLRHYAENPGFIEPPYRRNEVVRFVEGGLRDLSISRTTFSWGIPVPENPRHVIYVWFDALTNYITGAGFPYDMERFNSTWPCDIHLVGKDILRFHAVYWPAFLMSAGLPLPRRVFAHGWWTVEGEKMSKSLGNVVDPYEVVNTYGADAFRYFLLREIPFGQDGDFSREALVGRINGDLANGLGNLVSRSLGMIERYTHAKVPEPQGYEPQDHQIINGAAHAATEMDRAMEELAFSKALSAIWEFIGLANRYVDESAPWVLFKEGRTARLHTVLYVLTEALRVISTLCSPFIPASSQEIRRRLGHTEPQRDEPLENALRWGLTTPGTPVTKGESLFPRYE
jgi:methionyl-tRNA synthetase